VVFLLHLEEILAVRVIMGHRTGSRMPSRNLSNRWWLLIAEHFILVADLCVGLVASYCWALHTCGRFMRRPLAHSSYSRHHLRVFLVYWVCRMGALLRV